MLCNLGREFDLSKRTGGPIGHGLFHLAPMNESKAFRLISQLIGRVNSAQQAVSIVETYGSILLCRLL
jgi:hypothetical protein